MRSVKNIGWGGAKLNSNLEPALDELQSMRVVQAAGAAGGATISVTGMTAANGEVLSVVNLTDGANVSLAGLVYVAGGFQITASTASKSLLVQWVQKSAAPDFG